MGTPEFALTSLEALRKAGSNIAGVVTSPDKPAGRGQKFRTSPVKDYALEHGLYLLQPEKLKSQEFLQKLQQISPDIIIVVAFRMLPEEVWGLPPKGTINLHASLLPQYRGAAPIHRAIMNGEKETGATTFFIEKNIDTGKIILSRSTPIFEDDTAGSLHDRLRIIGAELLVETLHLIYSGKYSTTSQAHLIKAAGPLKTAAKIYPEDCVIDWDLPIGAVYDHIRGLSPHPSAWTRINIGGSAKILKIYKAAKEEAATYDPPGTVHIENGREFLVACRNGYIHIQSLQLEGKKRMPAADFLRGIRGDDRLEFLPK